ncbi:S8 family serine peptidase [Priestia aryabhattai]|uniref:S8 family serine peptidase n=1 Tax=Priestia aryabhattai TaxID=412384 RepID=UPI001CFF1FC3|nr:S8 family serine peptidase [Priestia aryabhattai]
MKKISCFVWVFISLIFFTTPTYAAEKHSEYKEIAIFKDNHVPEKIAEQIHEKFPEVNTVIIKEIGLLKYNTHSQEISTRVHDFLNNSYGDLIDEQGKESNFSTPSITPSLTNNIATYSIISNKKDRLINQSQINLDQWQGYINSITNNRKSYEMQKGNHSISVAIIDSGIDLNHPDLKENILSNGKSFVPNDPSTMDVTGHGTMVAGVIAANGRTKGVGPNIGIVPYKVIGKDGGEATWVSKAIVEAANDGHKVINISLGVYQSLKDQNNKVTVTSYKRAINYALKKKSIIVASAGNDSFDINNPRKLAQQRGFDNDLQVRVPSSLPGVITVGASTLDKDITKYSNYGKRVKVFSPGGDLGPLWETDEIPDIGRMVLTTYPTYLEKTPLATITNLPQGYNWDMGSSFSSPAVASLVALVISEKTEKGYENVSLSQVEKIINKSSEKGISSSKINIINVYKALKLVNRGNGIEN